jgi:hypothetical protein
MLVSMLLMRASSFHQNGPSQWDPLRNASLRLGKRCSLSRVLVQSPEHAGIIIIIIFFLLDVLHNGLLILLYQLAANHRNEPQFATNDSILWLSARSRDPRVGRWRSRQWQNVRPSIQGRGTLIGL